MPQRHPRPGYRQRRQTDLAAPWSDTGLAECRIRGPAPDNSQCAVNGALNVVLKKLDDSVSYDPRVFNGVTGFTNPVIFCSRRSRLARPDAILSAKRV